MLTPGPKYAPANCLLWNTLDTQAHVEFSAAGPNGVHLGTTTYGTGVFGGDMIVDANGEGANFYGAQLAPVAGGCWEMWIKPVGWDIVNGGSSDAINHYLFDNTDLSAGVNQMFVAFINGGMLWVIRTGGITLNPFVFTPAALDGLRDTWHHFAIVWAAAGIDPGGDTRRIYWDGAEVDDTGIALAPWPTFSLNNPWSIGCRNAGIGAYDQTFGGEIDNIKVFSYAKTDFSDRFTEGFTPPVGETAAWGFETPALRRPTVDLSGLDLSCRVTGLPRLAEEATQKSDLPFSASANVDVSNSDEAFSLQNPRSIFAGGQWQGWPIELYDRWGLHVFSGQLETISVNDKKRTTRLLSRSSLYRWRSVPVVYSSAADETPAEALLAVFTALGFTAYDSYSMAQSIAVQQAAGMGFRVTLLAGDGVTLAQFVGAMALYGVADVWEHLGEIYYRTFNTRAASPVISLDESDVLSDIKRERETNMLANDYAIGYTGPGTATDATAGNIGAASRTRNGTRLQKNIDADVNAQYEVRNAATAQYIGEQWIRWTHSDLQTNPRPPIEIRISVRPDTPVGISDDFALTFAREGWDEKPFRVTRLERDDAKRIMNLTAIEWGS